jgi:hypothetical protein
MPLGYPPYGQQSVPAYVPPPPPPRRGKTITIISSILVVIALLVAGGAALVLSRQSGNTSGPVGAQTSYSPTSTTGPRATATSTTSTGNVIFHDDFSSNTSGWTNDSHCFYGSDGYHIPDGYICYAPAGQFGDAIVSADMKQTAGEITWFYGIVFRRVSKGNFYELNIDSNGKWLFDKVVNDQSVDLIPFVHSNAIHTGLNATNHLEVHAVGTHFEFLINGVQVGQFDDSTYNKGLCGVEGGSPSGNVQVVVTQFTLALPS